MILGIDIYSFETLWPSLLGVAGIAATMTWGAWKMRSLMNEEPKD